jgi:hypothetical protein
MKSAPTGNNRSTNHKGHYTFTDNYTGANRQSIKNDALFLLPYLIAEFKSEIDKQLVAPSDILLY